MIDFLCVLSKNHDLVRCSFQEQIMANIVLGFWRRRGRCKETAEKKRLEQVLGALFRKSERKP
jgi:hypothetical protein